MKKNMKKLISVMLTLVMVFAMSITAFAEEATTLTIKGTATGHDYKVYQMLVGDVSSLANGSGTLSNVTAGADLKDAGTTEATQKAAVTAFDAGIKKDGAYLTGTDLAAAASSFIADPADPYATIHGNDEDQKIDVAPGYYVVMDTYTDSGKTCTAYMVAVVGPTEMKPKTSTTDIDKNITDTDANAALETGDSKKTDTAAIGDVINYQADSVVPVTTGYKYYYYVVNDTMSDGLTYNKDLVIYIGGMDDAHKLPADDYTLSETDHGFELVVKDMRKYTAGDAINITYSATVNEEAKIGVEPNTNTVKLTYSNNPSDTYNKDKNEGDKPGPDDVVGVTPDHTTKTYVTQVTIKKTDADTDTFIDALKGATFTLTGTGLNDVKVLTETVFVAADDGSYYKLKDGTYTETAPTEQTAAKYESTSQMYKTETKVSLTDEESGAELNITAVVDATGTITFTGLNAGRYKLVETNVPEGYNKAADIEFTISASQSGATELVGGDITWNSTNDKVQQVVNGDGAGLGVFEANIENQKGNTLPSTGGIGTTIFYVVGAVLVLGAGIIMVARRRAR